jgi:hypothetical protein
MPAALVPNPADWLTAGVRRKKPPPPFHPCRGEGTPTPRTLNRAYGSLLLRWFPSIQLYTYRNFPPKPGLSVEQSLASLGTEGVFANFGGQVPNSLVVDCVRLSDVIRCWPVS